MEIPSGAISNRDEFLRLEINQFRKVLAGVAEGHYWVDVRTGKTFAQVCLPEGVPINQELEDDLIEFDCRILREPREAIQYAGIMSAEQALSAIMVRQDARALEAAHLAVGASFAWNVEKVLV